MNSKVDKQLIYEIFRACRLCGAGGGYKMPIIQNIIDLEDSEIELREKIRECINIEINPNDCMPPLICELCVDKVNDFYEFLDMCRQTNKRTRLRLGLPLQTKRREATNTEDCILGVTEPIYVKDEDDEPLLQPKRGDETTLQSKKSAKPIKKEKKKIPEVKVKVERESPSQSSRTLRGNSSKESIDIISPRTSRSKSQVKFDVNNEPRKETSKQNAVKSILKKDTQPQKRSPKQPAKAVSVKETAPEDASPRSLKRCRSKEEPLLDASTKKVKISTEISPQKTAQTQPKFVCKTCNTKFKRSQALASHLRSQNCTFTNAKISKEISPKKTAQTQPEYHCRICDTEFKKPQGLANHLRSHSVTFTNVNLACNACCEWFPNAEQTAAHHRLHTVKKKPYHCMKCVTNFKNLPAYNLHIEKNKCTPWTENPDVKCDVCWKYFPTDNLRKTHKCYGKNRRPGGECRRCKKSFACVESLNQHKCVVKSRDYMKIRRKLLPMQVRVSKCDPLIADTTKEHYDVSMADRNFGLDPNCVYPYFSSSSVPIKREPTDDFEGMVNIKDDVKEEFCHEEDFIQWGSNNSSDVDQSDVSVRSSPNLIANLYKRRREVNSLSNLALKTIFSKNLLGKVSKKRRKSQFEKTGGDEEGIEKCDFPILRDLFADSANYSSVSIQDYISNNIKETDTQNSEVAFKDCRTDKSEESNTKNSYNSDIKRDVTNNVDGVQSTASEKTDSEKSSSKEIVQKSVTQRNDESEDKIQNSDKYDIEKVNNDNSETKTNCEIKDSNSNESENIKKSGDFCSKNVADSNVLNEVDSVETKENIEEVEKCDAYLKNNSNKTVDDVKDYPEIDAKIHRISRDGLGVGTDFVMPPTINKFEDDHNKANFNSNKFGCKESDRVESESHNEGIDENTQKNTDNLTRVCLRNGETFTDYLNSKKVDNSFEESEKEARLDSDIIGCNENDGTRNELEIKSNENNVQKMDAPSTDINNQSIDDDLEPISDTETDDDNLMAALEQRIGMTETEDKDYEERIKMEESKLILDDKSSIATSIDEILKSGVDTTGLDDVSDDEFNFDE